MRGLALVHVNRSCVPPIQLVLHHCPHPAPPSPTTRRSILLINSALCASAAFMAVVVCFKVLVFDPQTTVPPITAASAPIMTVGSNPTAPMIIAKIKVPPAAMATFEIKMNFRQLSITSASSSNVGFDVQDSFVQVTVVIHVKSTLSSPDPRVHMRIQKEIKPIDFSPWCVCPATSVDRPAATARKPRRSRRSNSSRLEAIGDNGRCQHVSENA